jgi:hypothetical protein
VRGPDEFDRTFVAITSASATTLLVLPDPVFSAYTARIADLANKSQLRWVSPFRSRSCCAPMR